MQKNAESMQKNLNPTQTPSLRNQNRNQTQSRGPTITHPPTDSNSPHTLNHMLTCHPLTQKKLRLPKTTMDSPPPTYEPNSRSQYTKILCALDSIIAEMQSTLKEHQDLPENKDAEHKGFKTYGHILIELKNTALLKNDNTASKVGGTRRSSGDQGKYILSVIKVSTKTGYMQIEGRWLGSTTTTCKKNKPETSYSPVNLLEDHLPHNQQWMDLVPTAMLPLASKKVGGLGLKSAALVTSTEDPTEKFIILLIRCMILTRMQDFLFECNKSITQIEATIANTRMCHIPLSHEAINPYDTLAQEIINISNTHPPNSSSTSVGGVCISATGLEVHTTTQSKQSPTSTTQPIIQLTTNSFDLGPNQYCVFVNRGSEGNLQLLKLLCSLKEGATYIVIRGEPDKVVAVTIEMFGNATGHGNLFHTLPEPATKLGRICTDTNTKVFGSQTDLIRILSTSHPSDPLVIRAIAELKIHNDKLEEDVIAMSTRQLKQATTVQSMLSPGDTFAPATQDEVNPYSDNLNSMHSNGYNPEQPTRRLIPPPHHSMQRLDGTRMSLANDNTAKDLQQYLLDNTSLEGDMDLPKELETYHKLIEYLLNPQKINPLAYIANLHYRPGSILSSQANKWNPEFLCYNRDFKNNAMKN